MEQVSGFVSSVRNAPRVPGADVWAPAAEGAVLPHFPVGDSASAIAAALEGLAATDLGVGDLIEVAAGWAQVMALATAMQADAVAQLLACDDVDGAATVDELACALRMTGRAAGVIATRAAGIAASPVLGASLRSGALDARKVDVILTETLCLVGQDAYGEVVADAAAAGAGLTVPQLTRYVRRLVVLKDPATARERTKRAREDRCVRLRPENDSMAWVSALLPAADAVAAFTAIDAMASGAQSALDSRTIDQRRADAFADVFTGILDSGHAPGGTPIPMRHGKRLSVQVTVAASTLLGLDDLPGELAGYGPIPASLARELAQEGTWRRILTDPATGAFLERGRVTYRPGADLSGTVLARDVTCTFPGCQQPAPRCEIDHIDPFDRSRPATQQTTSTNLQTVCKHHHQQKTKKRWNASRDPITGTSVWTSPAGITYARSPIAVQVLPSALIHTAARRRDDDPPPF